MHDTEGNKEFFISKVRVGGTEKTRQRGNGRLYPLAAVLIAQ